MARTSRIARRHATLTWLREWRLPGPERVRRTVGARCQAPDPCMQPTHGTGAGPALLNAVIDPEESAALWVADPNPRAHAFYRRHGFVADGTTQVEDGVREVRMVRGIQQSGS